MKVKKLLSLIFVAVIALGLASCDKCNKNPKPSTEAPTYTYIQLTLIKDIQVV